MVLYSLIQKGNNVSTFNAGKREITIVDLQSKSDINYLLFIGLFLFLLGLTLLIIEFYYKSNYQIGSAKNTLTQKENIVLSLIEKGYTNKDISNELSISVSTVKTHVNSIFKKKNISKREHLLP